MAQLKPESPAALRTKPRIAWPFISRVFAVAAVGAALRLCFLFTSFDVSSTDLARSCSDEHPAM